MVMIFCAFSPRLMKDDYELAAHLRTMGLARNLAYLCVKQEIYDILRVVAWQLSSVWNTWSLL